MKLLMLPTQNFPDSEPVIFFDRLLTEELWDLLVTKTNRYAYIMIGH